ncbi:DUF6767 domain-containing protein [Nanchangia anserum]|uniref:DUF6767 domain-containing protein n=1 Tax=Nanchangia anserum TaxID=2692125 RepID=UPI0030B80841
MFLAGGRLPVSHPIKDQEQTFTPHPESATDSPQEQIPPRARRHLPDAECPLRPGDPCTLCQAFVTGPHDCQTVRLVMDDPDLRAELAVRRREWAAAHRRAHRDAIVSSASKGLR